MLNNGHTLKRKGYQPMTFNRIAFTTIALTASAILAYCLALATSPIDYALVAATGTAAAILLGLLARYN
jgi:hypothetical protein